MRDAASCANHRGPHDSMEQVVPRKLISRLQLADRKEYAGATRVI